MEEWQRHASDLSPADQNHATATEGMSEEEFRKNLYAKLKSTGVLGTVKGQLRSQLLAQLQRNNVVDLGSQAHQQQQQHPPDLRRRVLNSMLVEYLSAARFDYSLSVFAEESGACNLSTLTHEELMGVLRIDEGSSLQQALTKAKLARAGQLGSCFLLQLLDAVGEVGSRGGAIEGGGRGPEALSTGGDRYQMDVRLQQLESEYTARLRAERMRPVQGVEERMAMYRQEVEEQAKAEVERQVARVRELEVAAARLDESTKWRRQLEKERQELERIHIEKMVKLRSHEEDASDRLKRQQREVESVAFEHRQRILREEERVRSWCAEMQQQSSSRQEQLRHLERALEMRERAVCCRESAAEGKAAEAAEAVAGAHLRARAEVEKEYLELKANLNAQRMQLEIERARVAEMRSEAAAECGAARSKEDQLRTLEAARAEAEARAAGHAADAEVVRMHAERLQLELTSVRDELSRRVAAAAGAADAMLSNAAGALGMLESEANATRGAGGILRQTQEALHQEKERCKQEKEAREEAERGLAEAQAAADKAEQQVAALTHRLEQTESLVEEAIAARQEALQQLAHSTFQATQLQRELVEVRTSLTRARADLAAQAQHVSGASHASTPYLPSPAHSLPLDPSRQPRQAAMHAATLPRTLAAEPLKILGPSPPSQDLDPALLYRVPGVPAPAAARSLLPASSPARPSSAAAPRLPGAPPSPPRAAEAGPNPVPSYDAPPLPSQLQGLQTLSKDVAAPRHSSGGGSGGGGWGAPLFGSHQQQPGVHVAAAGWVGSGAAPASRPQSPVQDRHDEVARQQAHAQAELAEYRRRQQAQQEAFARDLALARGQAHFSTSRPTSPARAGSPPAPSSRARTSLYSSPTRTAPLSALHFSTTPPASPPALPLPVPLPAALQLQLQPRLRDLQLGDGLPTTSFFPTSLSRTGSHTQSDPSPPPFPVPLPSTLQNLGGGGTPPLPSSSLPPASAAQQPAQTGSCAGLLFPSSSPLLTDGARQRPQPTPVLSTPLSGISLGLEASLAATPPLPRPQQPPQLPQQFLGGLLDGTNAGSDFGRGALGVFQGASADPQGAPGRSAAAAAAGTGSSGGGVGGIGLGAEGGGGSGAAQGSHSPSISFEGVEVAGLLPTEQSQPQHEQAPFPAPATPVYAHPTAASFPPPPVPTPPLPSQPLPPAPPQPPTPAAAAPSLPAGAPSGAAPPPAPTAVPTSGTLAPPPGLVLVDALPKAQPAPPLQPSAAAGGSARGGEQQQGRGNAGTDTRPSQPHDGDGGGSAAAVAAATAVPAPPKLSTPEEVQQAQAAKLRMLQEAQAVRLAAQRAREEAQKQEEQERERREREAQHRRQGSGDSSRAEQDVGVNTPGSSRGSQMGESNTPASAGGSVSSAYRSNGLHRGGSQQQQQQQQEGPRPARLTSSSNTQGSSSGGPSGLEVPQNESSSAGRSGKAQSSQQDTYSEDLDLPSGSLGFGGSVESEANLVIGFDDESNSGSVF